MSRACPVCTSQPLQEIAAEDVVVDQCGRCLGMFFDRGELELFPGRPSTRSLELSARHAPGRCPQGHAVARADRSCRTCSRPVCLCPNCGERFGQLPLGDVRVDLCARCGGLWLDGGEFEALEQAPQTAPVSSTAGAVPAGRLRGWEIPEAHDLHTDAWRAPGQDVTPGRLGSARRPFVCRHCDVLLDVRTLWVYEGDSYCTSCRPEGARSGAHDPDSLITLFGNLLGRLRPTWRKR